MRALVTAAACLFLAALATANCSVVEVLTVQPSSQRVRIIALLDGKPLKDASITVFTADEQPRLSLSTNKHGVAVLPPLPAGRYHIAATASGGLGADLILDLSGRDENKTTSFSMNLFPKPPPPPTFGEKIAEAEKLAPAEPIQQFKGVVADPSGARMPGTTVEIFQKGSGGKALAAQTKSDQAGQFSAHLASGSYTALFKIPGFNTFILVFEIAQNGEEKDLQISLQLAPCT